MNYSEIVKKISPIAFRLMENSFNNNVVPHSYLFSGQSNREIRYEYLYLIQRLISKPGETRNPEAYSDLIIIDGSESLIKKENVISAIEKLQATPLDDAGKKILVIRNIENANKQSVNSLLKFIEEPTKDTYIIMTTNKIAAVLPTIKSRSQILNLKPTDIDHLISEFESAGVHEDFSRLLANVISSKADLEKLDLNEVYREIDRVYEIMTDSLNNVNVLITDFNDLINKDNSIFIAKLIREFLLDIWRSEQSNSISFKNAKSTLDKYHLVNYDFSKAISYINEFIIGHQHYLNFDLQLKKLLIKLGECYE